MRAVIIGNGEIHDYKYIKPKIRDDDFIICADGGLRHINNLGINADIAIGDFDSAEKNDYIKTYKFPPEKDFTDGELAVNYAIDNGYNEILLLAMTGSRLDHTFTNIFQLAKSGNISLVDDNNEVHIIRDKLEIRGMKNATLSIIPVYGNLTGVTTEGLYYSLENETLYFGQSRGNSNIITDDVCKISVKDGIGIVFINNGE